MYNMGNMDYLCVPHQSKKKKVIHKKWAKKDENFLTYI